MAEALTQLEQAIILGYRDGTMSAERVARLVHYDVDELTTVARAFKDRITTPSGFMAMLREARLLCLEHNL